MSYYEGQQSVAGVLIWGLGKIALLLFVYSSSVGLALAIAAIPLAVEKDRWMRFALVTCGLFTVALLLETWMHLQYAAPITGLVLMLAVQSMRQMRLWRWRGFRVG